MDSMQSEGPGFDPLRDRFLIAGDCCFCWIVFVGSLKIVFANVAVPRDFSVHWGSCTGVLGIGICSIVMCCRYVTCNVVCLTELKSSQLWHHVKHCTQTATHHSFVHHRQHAPHLQPTPGLGAGHPHPGPTLAQGLWPGQLVAGILTFGFP